MRVVRVRREDAGEAIGRLLEGGLVDRGRRVVERGDHALVPLLSPVPPGALAGIEHSLGEVADDQLPTREQLRAPHDRVVREARLRGMPEGLVEMLPDSWERLGRVLVLRLPEGLGDRAGEAAGIYARELGVESVLDQVGTVTRVERRPTVRLVWGEGTRTVHREHGVAYEFDAARQMFSKGNVHERMRMGSVVGDGEVVVDMFAGIGYFTLPMAVLGSPSAVHACEIDPEAHAFLEANVRRNGVGGTVVPLLGDCREVAPRGVADRVVMGYVGGTEGYLDVAVEALREGGGVVHLHDKYAVEEVPDAPMEAIRAAAAGLGAELEGWREVKSYAPGIVHAVVDARLG